MTGLLPGVVVGGRYTLVRLLSEQGDAQAWAVRDDRLDRSVTLVVLPDDSPLAAGVYDAAQRAAGVDNHRLVRILDIAEIDGWVYFVEESLEGARSLTELAGAFGMAAEEVRRLTGEAALGLDAARRRGLHHLGLTPDNVLRMPDGAVKVAGLATQAALAGQDHIGGRRALRRDAKGLVALAYAGLTGRWPYAGDVGLQPAPRVVGGVPRPSELAVGVPNDLDTLCHLTLNQNLGPISPADYAAQVAPWSAMTVADQEVLATTPDAAEQAREADAAAAAVGEDGAGEVGPDQRRAASQGGVAASADVTAPIPVGPASSSDDSAHPAPTSWLTPAAAGAGAVGAAAHGAGGPSQDAGAAGQAGTDGAAGAAGTGVVGAAAVDAGAGAAAGAAAALGGLAASARKLTGRFARGRAATPVTAKDSAAGGDGDAADRMTDQPRASSNPGAGASTPRAGDLPAGATRPAVSAAPGAIAGIPAGDSARAGSSSGDVAASAAIVPGTAAPSGSATREIATEPAHTEPRYEAPAPLLPDDAGAPPTKAQSRFVLALFAALTALAGIVGAAGASQIGKGIDINAILGPDATHISTPKPTASSTSQGPSGTGEPLAIIGATGYDPEGGGDENNDLAARVYDEDPSTYWQSEGYQGPKFAGLKSGVGLVVDLGQEVSPSVVTLTLPNPSNVDVYLANEPDKTGAQLLGTISGKSGQVAVNSTSAATGRYIIVWFTDAPLVADGRYRAMLSEISVS